MSKPTKKQVIRAVTDVNLASELLLNVINIAESMTKSLGDEAAAEMYENDSEVKRVLDKSDEMAGKLFDKFARNDR